MPRCPVCESTRVVIKVDKSRRAFCVSCGARWSQEGSAQRSVRRSPLVTSLEREPLTGRLADTR
jgi:transposase-like protein